MQFLYPIGWLALAGVVIPLMIHLWNIKQGKTLKVGSIALLGESSVLSSRSYRFTDILLLILRLLIILLLAFLLAKPMFEKKLVRKTEKGWVLVQQHRFPIVYQQHRSLIDSLLKQGYQLHDFSPEFKTLSLNDTLQKGSIKDTLSVGYFNLLALLDQQKKPGFKTVLFADQQVVNMGELKPDLRLDLKWVPLQQTDSLKTWTSTYRTGKYEAVSSPASTVYSKVVSAGRPIQVMLKADRQADGTYIAAAIQAYAAYSKSKIKLLDYRPDNLAETDFIFWLSQAKIPAEIPAQLKQGGGYLSYVSGEPEDMESRLLFGGQAAGIMPVVQLNKRVSTEAYAGVPVWTDGFGTPILVKTAEANTTHYRFYTQFNPDWSELVWSPAFVRTIMPLIIGAEIKDGAAQQQEDQRILMPDFKYHPADLAAVNSDKSQQSSTQTYSEQVSLEKYTWFILLLLLCTERFFSFRKSKKLSNG